MKVGKTERYRQGLRLSRVALMRRTEGGECLWDTQSWPEDSNRGHISITIRTDKVLTRAAPPH